MKIYEITETRTDEAVPIVGGITVGAAILYVLSALSAGVTIWEFCNEAEVQGSDWNGALHPMGFSKIQLAVPLLLGIPHMSLALKITPTDLLP